jgi:hypothetical protein
VTQKSMAAQVAAGEVVAPAHVRQAMDAVKAEVGRLARQAALAHGAYPALRAAAELQQFAADSPEMLEAHREEWVRRHRGLSAEGLAAQQRHLYAYRYEVVEGEVLEIRVDGEDGDVRVIHRTDLYPPDKADPFSELASLELRLLDQSGALAEHTDDAS